MDAHRQPASPRPSSVVVVGRSENRRHNRRPRLLGYPGLGRRSCRRNGCSGGPTPVAPRRTAAPRRGGRRPLSRPRNGRLWRRVSRHCLGGMINADVSELTESGHSLSSASRGCPLTNREPQRPMNRGRSRVSDTFPGRPLRLSSDHIEASVAADPNIHRRRRHATGAIRIRLPLMAPLCVEGATAARGRCTLGVR
jgi:hypothetical protein